ncbi:sensor histidine kinase [Aeromicrobium sp. CF3.5]|uniref:sensor histidine kinase n=1 Tax=Aeromicrobium sp. CF3.5 TaxID=3373078 RepID=UPI003EE6C7CA
MNARSLSRQLAAPLVVLVVLVALVGILGGAGVWFATRSIDDIINRVAPTDRANSAVLQDLTDAETGVRGLALSGERRVLAPYQAALRRLPEDQRRLRELTAGDAQLRRLVLEQEQRVQAWLDDYARVRVARTGGEGSFDQELFDLGKTRFDAIRVVNGQVADRIASDQRRANRDAGNRLRGTLGLIAAVTTLGLLAGWALHRRLRRHTLPPLEDLASVARQLAHGEVDARARVAGPREVQQVAVALNALAEENQRAREAEDAIQSELRTLDAARGDFVANVSHELRTPLTSITGYLEILEDESELDDRHRRMIDAINRNLTRLRTLVEDLLTLSQAENRSTDLEQVDLRPLVKDAVADLGGAADQRAVLLDVSVPGELVPVLADRGQLHRVFLNLVSNAVKFSHEGGTVRIAVVVADGEAVTEIADEGIGIPAGEQHQLGSRFFRASNAVEQQRPGTGLGLRITRMIVDNHGGQLTIESEEGRGTRVRVALPLSAGEVDAVQ